LKAFPKKGKLSFLHKTAVNCVELKDLTSIKFQTISYKKINIYLNLSSSEYILIYLSKFARKYF